MLKRFFLFNIACVFLLSIPAVQAGTFDDLPNEVHALIASKVGLKGLANMSEVSHRYKHISQYDCVWSEQIPAVLRSYAQTLKQKAKENGQVFSYKEFYKQLVKDPIFYVVKDQVIKAGFKANFIYIYGDIKMIPTRTFYAQTKLDIGQREADIIDDEGNAIHLLRQKDFPAGVPHGIAVSGYSCLSSASVETDDIQKLNILHIDGYTGRSFTRNASGNFQSLQKDCVPPSAKFVLTYSQNENTRNYNVTIYPGYLHQ